MSDPDGLEIVRRLIAEVAESKTSSLDLSLTGITDLSPLGNLQNLTSIACSHISVSDLSPLANLQNLTSIDCTDTSVNDLSPLVACKKLARVAANNRRLDDFPRSLLDCSRLEELFLHETQVRGIPTGVLSTDPGSCCLESLRAHFADLIGGGEPDQDVKVIVIGNGRIGKTQICRRLHQWNYDETVDSTHGITVSHVIFVRLIFDIGVSSWPIFRGNWNSRRIGRLLRFPLAAVRSRNSV